MAEVPAPVGEKRCRKRPLSPQPSTSAASTPYVPEEEPTYVPKKEPTAVYASDLNGDDQTSVVLDHKLLKLILAHAAASHRPIPQGPKKEPTPFPFRPPKLGGEVWSEEVHRNSVYSHVDPNILIAIGQLHGLKSSRRTTRRRRINNIARAKIALRFSEVSKHLEPIVMEEIVSQRRLQLAVESLFGKFADTVNCIADKVENKDDKSDYARNLEKFEKMVAELRENRYAPNLSAAELKIREEENIRRMREEIEAAVQALSTNDPKEEQSNTLFTDILNAFKPLRRE